jgi:hypothetical protein
MVGYSRDTCGDIEGGRPVERRRRAQNEEVREKKVG